MTDRIFSLDWKHGWETMSGKPVRLLATDLRGPYPIAGTVSYDERDSLERWTAEGKYDGLDRATSSLDLRNRPAPKVKKKKVWVNVYANMMGEPKYSGLPYLTEEAAIENRAPPYLGTISGEIELPAEAS